MSDKVTPALLNASNKRGSDGGYEVVDAETYDWGRTVIAKISKDGKLYRCPIVECFYDTDEHGQTPVFREWANQKGR